MDFQTLWDFVSERRQQLLTDSYLHVSAVVQSVVIAGVIAVLVGIAVYRSPIGSAVATGLASTVLTLPSFALLGLLIPILGLGVAPTVTALVCCRSSGTRSSVWPRWIRRSRTRPAA